MGLRAGLDGRKISPPTGIRSADRPARSQSLYRLSYRAHNFYIIIIFYSLTTVIILNGNFIDVPHEISLTKTKTLYIV